MKKHLKVPIQERDAWLSKWHSGKKKNSLPAIAGDARDAGLIPGSGRSPGVGNGRGFPTLPIGNSWNFPFQENLACRIPWAEEPGGLQPMGSQGVGHD